MRRLFAMSAVVALVLSVSAGAVQADTSGGCSGATQCRFSGVGVDASWAGVPESGPVLGQTYTDTYVAASSSMTSAKGTRTSSSGLWFQQFSYVFDGSDKPAPVRESFVVDFGPDLVVRVDGKLNSATVSGTVMVVDCTFDADFNEHCGDPVATVVRGTWTAAGPALKVTSSYRAKAPGLTVNEMFQGTERRATAAVTIGGSPVPGTLDWGSILDTSGSTVSICHAPAC